ncbi:MULTISPECIES: helix-turn-helix domain-containing protein [Helcococcus]|uniref:Helix-turn-helix transcriptional regulator n=1 Tax=Helcococcus bovis TaxID=3153252 RepID=A0ABW9F740_9FIRM
MENKVDFKDRFEEILNIRQMNMSELSKKTGINRSSLSEYKSGKFIPKQDKVYIIAKTLNISPSWLMGFDVPMNTQDNEKKETPTQFTTTTEAIEFLLTQNVIAANTGIDISDYTDEEITQFANRLLDYARFLDNDKKKMD